MTNNKEPKTIAIVGCGPRGLSALESLYAEASKTNTLIYSLVFEKTAHPGASPVYAIDQEDGNWLNIAERAVDIWKRKKITFDTFSIPTFPTFQDWIGYSDKEADATDVDEFPLRSKMGVYLNERYNSIANVLLEKGLLTYIQGEVQAMYPDHHKVKIDVIGGQYFIADEAVLTIGHQPIELDEQLGTWKKQVPNLDTPVLFTQPYPIKKMLVSGMITPENSVGIRGFGLAMIDLLRAFSEGMGGTFKVKNESTREMEYIPSGKEPKTIVPFSLDGLPLSPKPLNKKIDSLYVPSSEQLDDYKKSVNSAIDSDETLDSTKFLIEAISPLIVDTYVAEGMNSLSHDLSKSDIKKVVESWLYDENFKHSLIIPTDTPAEEILDTFIGMATGNAAVSLDFCIGHVWRHCQPTMYKLLSFAPLSDELLADIIALDERLKRYSYGPPVDSLCQIIALQKVGKLTLDLVNDPAIELTEGGWILTKNTTAVKVETMINSVLPAPQILKVTSSLPKGLINSSKVEALHDELGIRTEKNGMTKFDDTKQTFPLAVLGRLAKGSLIGVDAIAECFGIRSEYWAEGVLERMHQED
ncbi:FAD/NAD(P)-binding protein [uncultured Dokdonia sp.]|uniref:FAD/NAD(P)-binding protein n=1 Tax=uncultured Dokdonia sp. TaxID=575653 RepID=UPI002617D2D9|nr:FAD/NAD(P)-binding protein [uncultured Dokdonia sp.]